MKQKHTPGPWKIVEAKKYGYNDVTHYERRIFTDWEHGQLQGPAPVVTMATCVGQDKGVYNIVSIAEPDARLIAAAPDLLDALEGFVACFGDECSCDDYDDGYRCDFCDFKEEIDKANAAIAKARGGE